MRLNAILICFLLIIASLSVYSVGWFKEGNSGYFYHGSMGLFTPTQNYSLNYKKCGCLETSLFEAPAYDFEHDGNNYFVLANSRIALYNTDCEYIASFNDDALYMPELTDLDNNGYLEITFLDSQKQLITISFNTETNTLELVANTSLPQSNYSQGMTCGVINVANDINLKKKCFLVNTGVRGSVPYFQTNMTIIDYSSGLATPTITTYFYYDYQAAVHASFPDPAYGSPFNYLTSYNDISISTDSSGSSAYIPVLTHRLIDATSTSFPVKMQVFDSLGVRVGFNNITTSTNYYAYSSLVKYHAEVVNINGNDKILLDIVSMKLPSDDNYAKYILGLNGALTSLINFEASPGYGNLMVNDFDKDGYNELMFYKFPEGLIELDETSATLGLYNMSQYGSVVSQSGVMGDFCPGGNLGIASPSNITCYNLSTNSSYTIYNDTKYTYSGAGCSLDKGSPDSTSCSPGSGATIRTTLSPVYGFSAAASFIIFRDNNIPIVCGDGVCSVGESVFTCAADCWENITFEQPDSAYISCLSDADCFDIRYPTCLLNGSALSGTLQGRCIASFNATSRCSVSNDCPITAPICYNTYCVAGVQGGYDSGQEINETALSSGDVQQSTTALINILFGGQTWLKFLVGMVLIILLTIEAGKLSGGNPFVITIAAFAGAIISTMLGLIPAYILILVILFLVLLLIFQKVIFGNPQ